METVDRKYILPTKNVKKIRMQLAAWYQKNQRTLPWRQTQNPYHIWISEVMLQQTQVNTAIPYFKKFINRFPDMAHLARAREQTVLKRWEGLGYYARARNLHRAVKIVLEDYNGNIPRDIKTFQKLPGVGDYIASAVLSIAFGQPYAVVDGNVKRVLARMFMVDTPVNGSGFHKAFKEIADRMIDSKRPATFNQAMMELGALVCRPKNPLCGQCPLKNGCRALLSRQVAGYPKRIPPKKVPLVHIAAGVVSKNGRVLITRRKSEGLLGGLWEFPGGKVKKGESAEQACIREIREEVNLNVDIDSFLKRVRHAYTHFKIVMDVYCCRWVSGRVRRTARRRIAGLKSARLKNFRFQRPTTNLSPC